MLAASPSLRPDDHTLFLYVTTLTHSSYTSIYICLFIEPHCHVDTNLPALCAKIRPQHRRSNITEKLLKAFFVRLKRFTGTPPPSRHSHGRRGNANECMKLNRSDPCVQEKCVCSVPCMNYLSQCCMCFLTWYFLSSLSFFLHGGSRPMTTREQTETLSTNQFII